MPLRDSLRAAPSLRAQTPPPIQDPNPREIHRKAQNRRDRWPRPASGIPGVQRDHTQIHRRAVEWLRRCVAGGFVSNQESRWTNVGTTDSRALGNFSSETLQQLLASPDVEFVEEDGVVNITADTGTGSTALHEKRALNAQTDAPWGLARISQDAKLTNQNTGGVFTYTYGAQAGQGVDIYVLGTFLNIKKQAVLALRFGDQIPAEAPLPRSTAPSPPYVAPPPFPPGSTGNLPALTPHPPTQATNAGIAFVTTAGNSNSDAGNFSPGRVPSAITVGASTIADAVSASSNHGAALKLYAPGQNVLSAWIGSTAVRVHVQSAVLQVCSLTKCGIPGHKHALRRIFCASPFFPPPSPSPYRFLSVRTHTYLLTPRPQAAAHVAGLAAYLLSVIPSSLPVATALANTAVQGVLANVPAGTVNRLASNNVSRLGIAL
ncbi:hypothetical protein H0H81_009896 [Sphagnurus paluster]|uniref:Peptidase S8/S53 domain-containing protein n=1 Tax=Sphagnurus paluster TaxID=117069 RepID=A0A9P7GUD4_9AGAR|nr:hypothetical protein H0H81_009896 [Sphagnurus paluster]